MKRLAWLLVLLGSALLASGNLLMGALVAPLIFASLNRDQAGLAFDAVLKTWSQGPLRCAVALICIGLALLCLRLLLQRRFARSVFALLAGLALIALHIWSQQLVDEGEAVRKRLRSLDNAPVWEEEDSAYQVSQKHLAYLLRTATWPALAESMLALLLLFNAGTCLLISERPSEEESVC